MTIEHDILRHCRTIIETHKAEFETLREDIDLVARMFLHVFSKEDGARLEEEIAALRRLLESMTQ